MKLRKHNNFTYVEEATSEELNLLRRTLAISHVEYSFGVPETVYEEFLYQEEFQYKFFTGLLDYVFQNLPDLTFEIEDKTNFKSFDLEVTKDILNEIELRDDQVFSIKKCLKSTYGVIDLPTRTGKTEVFCGVSKLYQDHISQEKKIIIIEDQVGLMRQTAERLKLRGVQNVGMLGDGEYDYDSQIIVCVIDTLYNSSQKEKNDEFFAQIGGVIVDECFPAGTLVDGVLIQNLKKGDLVRSFNHNTKKVEWKRIKQVFKNELKGDLNLIKFSNGSEFLCTGGHPIYNSYLKEYIPARDLNCFSKVYSFKSNRTLHKESWVEEKTVASIWVLTQEEKGLYCRDGFVYNIEVEDNNNYFAEGILVHNCHHMSAVTYKQLASSFESLDLLLGFSGTPFEHKDNHFISPRDVSLVGVFHRTIIKISTKFFIDKGIISEPNVFFISYEYNKPPFFIQNYNKVYERFVVGNKARNQLAVNVAKHCYAKNLSFLISIVQIAHGKKILGALGGMNEVVFSYGDNTSISLYSQELENKLENKIKKIVHDKDLNQQVIQFKKNINIVEEVNNKNFSVIIGSTIFDEGRDIPSLDGAFLMGGGASFTKTIQRAARTLTRSDTRSRSFIIDFRDNVHTYLKNHSNSREKLYLENYYNVYEGVYEFIKFLDQLGY